MHAEAFRWVADHRPPVEELVGAAVLDIGGRNINGSIRSLFQAADPYVSLDITDGPGVDIVTDAATWQPDREYDLVICCEVFEHTPMWAAICATAWRACCPGGLFIATMAGPGRAPHSAVDGGGRLYPGEYYGNVDPEHLRMTLLGNRWTDVLVDQQRSPADVRAVATKPSGVRGG